MSEKETTPSSPTLNRRGLLNLAAAAGSGVVLGTVVGSWLNRWFGQKGEDVTAKKVEFATQDTILKGNYHPISLIIDQYKQGLEGELPQGIKSFKVTSSSQGFTNTIHHTQQGRYFQTEGQPKTDGPLGPNVHMGLFLWENKTNPEDRILMVSVNSHAIDPEITDLDVKVNGGTSVNFHLHSASSIKQWVDSGGNLFISLEDSEKSAYVNVISAKVGYEDIENISLRLNFAKDSSIAFQAKKSS